MSVKPTLGDKRRTFTALLCGLIKKINSTPGYSCFLGDVAAKDGHAQNSFHYVGLAADVNLFKDGKYLTATEDHAEFGAWWKAQHPDCTWGGDFPSPDGNHYSFGERRR